MKKINIFFAFLLLSGISYGQSLSDTNWKRSLLFDEFTQGAVLLKTGAKEQASLNYNTDNQQVYFIQDGKYLMLTNLSDIDSIYLQGKVFVPVNDAFYEFTGTTGSVGLFVTYTNKLRPVTATADHNGTSRKDNNKVMNTVSNVYTLRPYKGDFVAEILAHYWLRRGRTMYKANTENQLLKVFPFKDNKAVQDYIETNKIDFKRQADIVKLVNYCNSLVK